MTEALIIGVPSKGRLQEQTADLFKRTGLSLKQPGGARNYRGVLDGIDNVEIAFLSASEIAKEIAAGHVHLGVTGLDLIHEKVTNWRERCHLVTSLGFGQANVVLAIPKSWIDVTAIEDLVDVAARYRQAHGKSLRIATKYTTLARKFCATYNIADYRIVESLGATEGAPAAGSAEVIVDITTSGATLEANHLKVPKGCTILRSEAHLVASKSALWSPHAMAAARVLLDRVAADTHSRNFVEIRADFGYDPVLIDRLVNQYGVWDPFGAEARPMTLLCPLRHRHKVVDALREGGAQVVMISKLDDIFSGDNALFASLEKALG